MSSSKLFAVCEELKSGAAKENMDKLKFLTDARYMTFEAKHTDAQRSERPLPRRLLGEGVAW